MNKPVCSLLLLLSSSFVLAACGQEEAPSSSVSEVTITLSQTSATLEQFETLTLTAEVLGSTNAVTWTSSNTEIATVKDGEVTALKAGQTTIKASIGEKSATCDLTVTAISQAPRIVMSDIDVSVDKDQTYGVEAYVLYKDEKVDATLEVSLKDGSDAAIAEVAYKDGKINVKGLKYGEATYIVHTKALGITLSQILRVKVANSSLRLALKNATAIDDVYGIELINEKVAGDDSEYNTEFTPEVEFTEKGNPASYALTYTSSNEDVAAWENGKIVAKKNGEATLKIVCQEFALSLEIDVTVYKGAYNLVLKNVNEDGTDGTIKVAAGKFPATPTLANKTFIGWYDLEGNPVDKILDDTTLVARYTKEYRDLGNESLMEFSENRDDYEAVDDAHKLPQVRSASDKAADITEGKYQDIKGQGVFFPWAWWKETGDGLYSGPLGLKLPKFDFSKSGNVFFNFGITGAANNFVVEGVDCGSSQGGVSNYQATVKGKKLTIHNVAENKDYEITLKDAIYNGEEGICITNEGFPYLFMTITPFKVLDCDYIAKAEALESSLPDTPVNEAAAFKKVKEYQAFRALYSEQEASIYPVSEKMQAWINALPHTIVTFQDHGASVAATAIGDAGKFDCSADAWAAANRKGGIGESDPFDRDANSLVARIRDLMSSYVTFTLPAVDLTQYAKVTFTMGFGGNGGTTHGTDFAFGNVPEGTKADLTGLDNYIGQGRQTTDPGWSLSDDIEVTMTKETVTFNAKYQGDARNPHTITNKVFNLSDDIKTGKKGLTLTMANVQWEFFVISPFVGYTF